MPRVTQLMLRCKTSSDEKLCLQSSTIGSTVLFKPVIIVLYLIAPPLSELLDPNFVEVGDGRFFEGRDDDRITEEAGEHWDVLGIRNLTDVFADHRHGGDTDDVTFEQ